LNLQNLQPPFANVKRYFPLRKNSTHLAIPTIPFSLNRKEEPVKELIKGFMTPQPEMASWLTRLKSVLLLEEANLIVSRGWIIKLQPVLKKSCHGETKSRESPWPLGPINLPAPNDSICYVIIAAVSHAYFGINYSAIGMIPPPKKKLFRHRFMAVAIDFLGFSCEVEGVHPYG